MLFLRWLLVVLLGLFSPASVLAQSCTADSQCRDYGRTRTTCVGNTLVAKRSVCIGSCREVEEFRLPCPGPCVGDRCIGGPVGSQTAEPPLGGSVISPACAEICECRGKVLSYGVGRAAKARDCGSRTVNCKYGCSCDGRPRCLKAPAS